MPIPDFNEHGLLPEGVHDCELEELRLRFGSFQTTDRRVILFQKLLQLLQDLQRADVCESVIVDGSFTTDTPLPNDIDLIIVYPVDYELSAELSFFQYNATNKSRLRKRYGFDVFPVVDQSLAFERQVGFFGQVKFDPDLRKGMLRITL